MTASSIPKTQDAAVRQGSGDSASAPLKQVEVLSPKSHEILVKINWSGLCASDKSLIHDEWKDFGVAMQESAKGICGHEGAGVVVAVGDSMHGRWKVGDRAGMKWVYSTCGECEFCLNGTDELHCTKQLNCGFTAPGTFQQYAISDGRYTSRIPDGVKDEEAGPIMCGGVTAYTACKRSTVKPGQWLVVTGAGGGLGHFAVQYAKAMGMRVIAIDGGDEKRDLCKKLGAEVFIDYLVVKDIPAEVVKTTTHGAHAVIVFSATKEGYASAPAMLRPGGTMVAVGLPKDPSVVAGAPPLMLALKRLQVVGSVVGTLKDVEEALDFTARDLVHVSLRPCLSLWIYLVSFAGLTNSFAADIDQRRAERPRPLLSANDGRKAGRTCGAQS
jgi:propanol-preferring alcohol dehydrogenase